MTLPCQADPATEETFSPEQVAFFEAKIRPIFVEHCWKCHADDERGNLRLDSRDSALAGGDSGPALVPGAAEASLMVKAVHYADPAYQMPPSGKLPAAAVAAIEEWVTLGAPYP
ncbi:MAG: c-type cytochrome domain-containing protein, partial [Planctomycetota bacterium]